MKLTSIALLAVFAPRYGKPTPLTGAGDDEFGHTPPDRRRMLDGTRHLQTTSPFPPPTATSNLFVLNSGTGLDTGCTYTYLNIPFPVGAIDTGATSFQLQMPAFDVDSPYGEVDQVKLNGNSIGLLDGDNGIW